MLSNDALNEALAIEEREIAENSEFPPVKVYFEPVFMMGELVGAKLISECTGCNEKTVLELFTNMKNENWDMLMIDLQDEIEDEEDDE